MTKEERKQIAVNHTNLMIKYFSNDINQSLEKSKVYNSSNVVIVPKATSTKQYEFSLVKGTTQDAIYSESNIVNKCALNFASYTRPGGGFINGSMAQEEALCHSSFLYNVLKEFTPLYDKNYMDKNKGLYRDFAIYSPDIIFTYKDKNVKTDIITCAAPNYSVFEDRTDEDRSLYKNVLSMRIKFILDILEMYHNEVIILGAFGCGVFKNDPELVAETFINILKNYDYHFRKVIFAIPDDTNYNPFKDVIKKYIYNNGKK